MNSAANNHTANNEKRAMYTAAMILMLIQTASTIELKTERGCAFKTWTAEDRGFRLRPMMWNGYGSQQVARHNTPTEVAESIALHLNARTAATFVTS